MQQKIAFAVGVLASAVGTTLPAAELKPATLAAWDKYVQAADAKARDRIYAGQPLRPSITADQESRLRRGQILLEALVDRGTLSIQDGLIHDWFATMFIPGATLEDLFTVLHNYDHYTRYLGPTVADSKMLASSGAEQRFSMLWTRVQEIEEYGQPAEHLLPPRPGQRLSLARP